MSLEAIKLDYRSKLSRLGKAGLNAIFPKDQEYYLLALELVDSQKNTVDYFAWPILPVELRETHVESTTISRSLASVIALKNPTFNPRQIHITGTFGRDFKLLLGSSSIAFAGFSFSINNGKFDITAPNLLGNTIPQLSSFAKSGYGCVKVLEAIKEKSKKLDQFQKPYTVYLYNPILGNNYVVEFNSFSHLQNNSTYNMVPMYDIQLTAVASLDSVLSYGNNIKSALKNLTLSNIQKTASNVASGLRLIKNL